MQSSACPGPATAIEFIETDRTTPDGLYRIRALGIGGVFTRPGASLASYDAAAILPFSVDYASPPIKPTVLNRDRSNFELGEQSMGQLQSICNESIRDAVYGGEGLAPATAPGPGVLVVQPAIRQLVVDLPPPRGGQTGVARSMGSMMVIIDVRDALSGESLLRIADHRALQPDGERGHLNDWVNLMGSVRFVCSKWSRSLQRWLGDLRRVDAIPQVASRN